MGRGKLVCAALAALALGGGTAALAAVADVNAVEGVIDYLKPINPDPIIQHAKEAYVRNGCAYCHGVDLHIRNGEAADLYNSPLVAADRDGNQLGPLLRRGIPQTPKLSPMPQYSDLSDAEVGAIVRWIHYARQQRRFAEVGQAKLPAGNIEAGKTVFDRDCASCHTAGRDFAPLRARRDPAALARQILQPDFVKARPTMVVKTAADSGRDEARARHLALLERQTPETVSNLVTYLQTW